MITWNLMVLHVMWEGSKRGREEIESQSARRCGFD